VRQGKISLSDLSVPWLGTNKYGVAFATIVVELLAIISGDKKPIGIYLRLCDEVLGISR